MSHLIKDFKYRPEVDGLRAVAVVPVVMYHAGLGFSGGFVGVDVFFVISGYLITSLIVKEIEQGVFSFLEFWGRRARRIIPALAVVVLAVLVVGWFFLLPIQYADLGKSTTYLVLLIANVYFYLGTGYFSGTSEEKPLLHTWSLAVEEQFYLFVPLMLFVLLRYRLLRSRSHLLMLFGAGIILSLFASIFGVTRHPAATFYLLPTRAWELICGSFIALLPSAIVPRNYVMREVLAWLGLLAILIPCILYTKQTPFPGLAAIPPCIGASLFIWATANPSIGAPQHRVTASRLLSSSGVVFFGLISYSLYLWHWPLIAFSNYWSLEPQSLRHRICIVFVSILLAIVSWRFVEKPFRTKRFAPTRGGMFRLAGTTAVVLMGLGVVIVCSDGMLNRLPNSLQGAFARNPEDDLRFVQNFEASDVIEDRLATIGSTNPDADVKFLVWGDSHAMAATPAFDEFFKRRGIAGRLATYSSRAPLLDWYGTDDVASKEFNEAVLSHLEKHRIRDVFLVACWTGYGDHSSPERLQNAIEFTIRELIASGCRPWIVLMVPNHKYDVPKAITIARIFGRNESDFCSKPSHWNGIAGTGTEFIRRLERAGARVIDPRTAFFDPACGCYRMSLNGKALYRDQHHLSMAGAQEILLPLLVEMFDLRDGD